MNQTDGKENETDDDNHTEKDKDKHSETGGVDATLARKLWQEHAVRVTILFQLRPGHSW